MSESTPKPITEAEAFLRLPWLQAPPTRDRLIGVGRALFARLVDDAQLNVIDLPDTLGVCLVHASRGGGKIYVAADESALFVGSAVDFDAGLTAFRDGARTDPEKFNLNK